MHLFCWVVCTHSCNVLLVFFWVSLVCWEIGTCSRSDRKGYCCPPWLWTDSVLLHSRVFSFMPEGMGLQPADTHSPCSPHPLVLLQQGLQYSSDAWVAMVGGGCLLIPLSWTPVSGTLWVFSGFWKHQYLLLLFLFLRKGDSSSAKQECDEKGERSIELW